MRTKSLLWIFGSLAVLLIVYAGLRIAGAGAAGRASHGLAIAEWVDEGATLIRVLGPAADDSLRLDRATGKWTVNGYPADSAAVRRLLSSLGSLREGELIARSPENHGRLGVAGPGSRRVEIGPPGDPAVSFFLGGSGPRGRYVRLDGADEVYLVDASALDPLTRDPDTWRDRSIATLDTARVRRVEIRREGTALTLSRGEEGWRVGEAVADTARVRRMLEALADLRATGFPTDSAAWQADFEAPDATVDVYDDAGEGPTPVPLLSLLFAAENEGSAYLVRRADRPLVVELAGWSADRILVSPDEVTATE